MSATRIRPYRLIFTACTAAAVVGLAACSSSGGGTASDTSSSSTVASGSSAAATGLDAVCAAGAQEGTLNFVSRTDPEVFAEEVKPFEAKYPGIKVAYDSQTPSDETQTLITESQAGHSLSADATIPDLASAQPLFDAGLIDSVDWASLGIPSNLITEYGGVSVFRTFRDLLGIGYNTQQVKKEDLPTTWNELLDPKWSGKVVVDPRGTYVAYLAAAWGQDKTMQWLDKFLGTKPMILQGTSDSIAKVVSGEALLTTSATASAITEQQKDGAPVDIAYLDVVGSQDKYGMVLKGAEHPNAAKCFLGWWGSAEGQAQQEKYEYKTNTDTGAGMPASATTAFATDQDTQKIITDATDAVSKKLNE